LSAGCWSKNLATARTKMGFLDSEGAAALSPLRLVKYFWHLTFLSFSFVRAQLASYPCNATNQISVTGPSEIEFFFYYFTTSFTAQLNNLDSAYRFGGWRRWFTAVECGTIYQVRWRLLHHWILSKEDWTSTAGATIAILWIRACLDRDSQWTANRSLWPNIKGRSGRRFQGYTMTSPSNRTRQQDGWSIMLVYRYDHSVDLIHLPISFLSSRRVIAATEACSKNRLWRHYHQAYRPLHWFHGCTGTVCESVPFTTPKWVKKSTFSCCRYKHCL